VGGKAHRHKKREGLIPYRKKNSIQKNQHVLRREIAERGYLSSAIEEGKGHPEGEIDNQKGEPFISQKKDKKKKKNMTQGFLQKPQRKEKGRGSSSPKRANIGGRYSPISLSFLRWGEEFIGKLLYRKKGGGQVKPTRINPKEKKNQEGGHFKKKGKRGGQKTRPSTKEDSPGGAQHHWHPGRRLEGGGRRKKKKRTGSAAQSGRRIQEF